MASKREYELLFQLNAQLGGSYNSTFGTAQKALVSMQKEIDALGKIQSDISSYQKQQMAIEASRKKLEVLQQQYNNIKREMGETGQSSADLQNKLLAKQLQMDKTSSSINTQTSKLDQLSASLRAAGVNTDEFAKESSMLGGQIDALKAKQEEAAEEAQTFGTSASEAFTVISQAIAAAGISKALQEIYEWYGQCAEASMQFESAITGVAKTTNFSDEELAAMSQSIKEMSAEIPATTTELGAIAETAGQLGIAKGCLIDFTEIMAELGTATNMTSDEAATMLAQFASITGMDPSLYSNLGSTIVALGNSYATTEKNVADMSQRIAAAGSIAGMSEADILAAAAAVTSLGIQAENGGTQMAKLISDINSAVSSGEGLEQWASAAEMNANDFADAWGANAAGALNMFIEGLHNTYAAGGDVYSVLNDLGITETRMVTMVTSLAKSGDRLNDTLQTANTAWTDNTALSAEAEKRYATTQSELILLQNAYNNLKIAVGDGLNPTLSELYTVGADVLNWAAEFAQQNPELVKGISIFIGVLGTATGALAAYTLATKIATAMNAALGLSLGPIMAAVVAYSALAGIYVALGDAMNPPLDESWELTAASRAQYNELQQLNEEYEKTVDLYGETSYEAQRLQWQIEDLNAEYENGKQTFEEYQAAHDELMASYDEMVQKHQEAYKEIKTEEHSVLALVMKLKELTSTTDSARENQQAILAIINALNEAVPDLALSYDDVIKNSGVVEVIENTARAQAAQKRLAENWNDYVDRLGNQEGFKADRDIAAQNARLAQQEYDAAKQAYNEALGYYEQSDALSSMMGTSEEGAAMDEAKAQLDEYNADLVDAAKKYYENEEAISDLEDGLQAYQDEQEAAAESGGDYNNVIADTKSRIDELTTAYNEAYTAALDSVGGQYELWDEAARVVAISVGSMNANLDTQSDYWRNYNDNLASLSARTGEIQGLSDVIASFADGSEESVNAIAGMAAASDHDLAAMVTKWQTVKQEQETTAANIAELQTDFSNSMAGILQDLTKTADEMDLSSEAYAAGMSTINAYINSLEDESKLSEAYQAARALAKAAADGFRSVTGGSIKITASGSHYTPGGYADGTFNAASGWAWVGEQGPELMYMGGGQTVLPSDISMALSSYEALLRESVSYTQAQQLMAQMAASGDLQAAGGSGYSNTSISMDNMNIRFEVAGGSNAEIEAAVNGIADKIKDKVLEALEDAGIDDVRRRYN